jgi:hypothetical protein
MGGCAVHPGCYEYGWPGGDAFGIAPNPEPRIVRVGELGDPLIETVVILTTLALAVPASNTPVIGIPRTWERASGYEPSSRPGVVTPDTPLVDLAEIFSRLVLDCLGDASAAVDVHAGVVGPDLSRTRTRRFLSTCGWIRASGATPIDIRCTQCLMRNDQNLARSHCGVADDSQSLALELGKCRATKPATPYLRP